MMNEYYPNLAIIKEIKKQTINTNTFVLKFTDQKIADMFSWEPGQFMMLSILGIGESAISISGVENDNLINATIRNVGNVTNSIFSLKKGDSLGMRGPYGTGWPLKEIRGKDILIVAGGMGLAPLHGVINHVIKNRTEYGHLEIIYGARTPGDMVFKDEFSKWKKIKNSTFFLTADEITGENPFECKTGLVTSCFPMMKTYHRNAVALICGPEIMMRFAAKCLETIGFADKQIYLSLERRMKCGIGKCGHCQIGLKYVCKDGPVFNYADIKPFIRPL
jgi:sulfhydrogenase subunit gamma (sulfur reductase)